jgi:hypothetical protein
MDHLSDNVLTTRDLLRLLCIIARYIVDHALSIGIMAPLIIFASSEAKNAMPRATSSTPMTGTGVPSLSFETWS